MEISHLIGASVGLVVGVTAAWMYFRGQLATLEATHAVRVVGLEKDLEAA